MNVYDFCTEKTPFRLGRTPIALYAGCFLIVISIHGQMPMTLQYLYEQKRSIISYLSLPCTR